jgi:hypothetical protein
VVGLWKPGKTLCAKSQLLRTESRDAGLNIRALWQRVVAGAMEARIAVMPVRIIRAGREVRQHSDLVALLQHFAAGNAPRLSVDYQRHS